MQASKVQSRRLRSNSKEQRREGLGVLFVLVGFRSWDFGVLGVVACAKGGGVTSGDACRHHLLAPRLGLQMQRNFARTPPSRYGVCYVFAATGRTCWGIACRTACQRTSPKGHGRLPMPCVPQPCRLWGNIKVFGTRSGSSSFNRDKGMSPKSSNAAASGSASKRLNLRELAVATGEKGKQQRVTKLEAKEDDQASAASAASGSGVAPSSGVVNVGTQLAVKKRAVQSSGSGAARSNPTPKKRRKDEVEDDADCVSLAPSGGTQLECDDDEPATCDGCFRSSHAPSSFMAVGGEIEFQYKSRYCNFCKDCHAVWRLLYKPRLTLLLLKRHLRHWDRRIEFLKQLVSLLLLRYENHSRATAALLAQKVSSLNWLFSLLNIPWPLFCVVDLKDLDMTTAIPAALNFVQCRSGGVRKLMCLTPLPPPAETSASAAMPVTLLNDQQQRLWPTLHTDQPDELEWWKQHITSFVEEPNDRVDEAEAGGEDSQDHSMDTPSGEKYKMARDITLACLHDLTSERWRDGNGITEKAISKQLTRVLKLQHEVASGPESAVYIGPISSCVAALSSARKSLPHLIAYQKTFSSERLGQLHLNSSGMKAFFQEHHRTFGAKVRQTFWRAELEAISASSGFGKVCEKLIEDAGTILDMHPDATSASLFVQDCIINVVSNFLSSAEAKDKTNEVVRDSLIQITEALAKAVGDMKGEHSKTIHALKHALTILEAAAPETKVLPGQLVASKEALSGDDNLKKMWHLWFQSTAGTVLLADADMLLVSSALDAECLNDFLLAQRVLEEPGAPRRDGACLAGSWDLFSSEVLASLFSDAAKQLCIALTSWSPVGIDEHCDDIRKLIAALSDWMLFIDCAASRAIVDSWMPLVDGWTAHFDQLPLNQGMPLVSQEMSVSAANSHSSGPADLTEFLAGAHEALNNMMRLKGRDNDMNDAINMFQDKLVQLRCNDHARFLISAELEDLALLVADAFENIPVSYKELLAEYQQGAEGSTLGTVVRMQGRRRHDNDMRVEITSRTACHVSIGARTIVNLEELNMQMDRIVQNKAYLYFRDRFIVGNLQAALESFWSGVSFLAQPPASDNVDESDSPVAKDIFALVPKLVAQALYEDIERLLAKPIEGCSNQVAVAVGRLDQVSSHQMCGTLLLFCCEDSVEVPGLYDGNLEKKQLTAILGSLRMVFQMCAAAAWVLRKFLSDGGAPTFMTIEGNGSAFSTMAPHPGLEASCAFMVEEIEELKSQAAAHASFLDGVSGLRFNGTRFKHAVACLDAFVSGARAEILRKYSAAVEEQASLVEQLCPRWSHIISDDDYNQALAKRQILKAPGRTKLPDATNKLESLLGGARFDTWLGTSSVAVEPAVSEATAVAESTLHLANLAITVTGAVNLVEDFSNTPQGVSWAKEFLAEPRPRGFPRALLVRVEEMAKSR